MPSYPHLRIDNDVYLTPDESLKSAEQLRISAQFLDTNHLPDVKLIPGKKWPTDDKWQHNIYDPKRVAALKEVVEYPGYGVGVNLVDGWGELDADFYGPNGSSPQTSEQRHVFNAIGNFVILKLGLRDSFYGFGRSSVGNATKELFRLSGDDATNFPMLSRSIPKALLKFGDYAFKTEVRTENPADDGEGEEGAHKQTVLPGQVLVKDGQKDMTKWYTRGPTSFATTARTVDFHYLLKIPAYKSVIYMLNSNHKYLLAEPGARQDTWRILTGLIARTIVNFTAIDETTDLRLPVTTRDEGATFIEIACAYFGDDETRLRVRGFDDALAKLGRNPHSITIPGFPALVERFGEEFALNFKILFTGGEKLASIFELMKHKVLFHRGAEYEILDAPLALEGLSGYKKTLRRAAQDYSELTTIKRDGKPAPIVSVLSKSAGRFRIDDDDWIPEPPSETKLRFADIPAKELDDKIPELVQARLKRYIPGTRIFADDDYAGKATVIFNTFPDWPIKPKRHPDIQQEVRDCLFQHLDILARGRAPKRLRLMAHLAQPIQFPLDRKQVAPVLVGGQGTGKSSYAMNIPTAAVGNMCKELDGKNLGDRFGDVPLLYSLFCYIEEARYNPKYASEYKRIIRVHRRSMQLKGIDAKDYDIYARLSFSANRDIHLGDTDMYERSIDYFRTPSWITENKDNEDEFNDWVFATLKPFFTRWLPMLKLLPVREQLLLELLEFDCSQVNLEDISDSDFSDPWVRDKVESHAIKAARRLIELEGVFAGKWGHGFFDIDVGIAFKNMYGERGNAMPPQADVMGLWESWGIISRGKFYTYLVSFAKAIEICEKKTKIRPKIGRPLTEADHVLTVVPPPSRKY